MKRILSIFASLVLIFLVGCGSAGGSPKIASGTTYTYMQNKWNLYIATFLSDKTVKIERWGRFNAREDGDPFKYENDVLTFSTEDSKENFKWLDGKGNAFSITMKDDENSYWEEISTANFVLNNNVTESNTLDNSNIYTYLNDKWDLYVAVKISDTLIKVEKWYRGIAGRDGIPFAYVSDFIIINTEDTESSDFSWADDEHSSFSISINDSENSYWDENKVVSFARNENYLESNAEGAESVYTYLNDKWNLYVAIPVSDTTIKIEEWDRFDASEDGDPFVYEYDVVTVSTESEDNYNFSWLDDTHAAFTIDIKDEQNSRLDEVKNVAFTIEPDFESLYSIPANDYLNSDE